MGVGLKSGIWKTHRRHAEEERIRAKDMALKTVTFQGLKRKSIEETKKDTEKEEVKQMGHAGKAMREESFQKSKNMGS